MAQAVSARPPICENATVEKMPMAPMTIKAPAYQSRCAASNLAAGAEALSGDLLDKNARSRSKSAALITPAFDATRRSPSEYAIAVSPVFHLPPRGLISARFGARTEPVIAVRQSSVQRILNNVKLFKHCSHISLRSYRPRAATGGRIGSGL